MSTGPVLVPRPGLRPPAGRRAVRLLLPPVLAGAVSATGVGLAFPAAAAAALPHAPVSRAGSPGTLAAVPRIAGPAATAVRAEKTIYLHYGSRGQQVVAVQKALGWRRQTGFYGSVTTRWVASFQRRHDLPATGAVDNTTWKALGLGAVASPPSPGVRLVPGTEAFGKRIMALARQQLGKPYRWGSAGPNAFDCSGLTSYVYRRAGFVLPRTARAQHAATRRITKPAVGDLAFVTRSGRVGHVAIVAGGGKWFQASTRSKPVGYGAARSGSAISYGRFVSTAS